MLKHLQINAESQKILRRIAWMAVAFLSLIAVVSAVEKKEGSLASEMAIEIAPLPGGERLLTGNDVRLAIERSFGYQLEGRTLASIDIERVERVLEEDPFILDAEAYLGANNRIKIRIEQREPILRVMDNNGLNYYLDRGAVRMPLSPHFTARVMVVTGNLPPYEPDFLERKRNMLKDAYLLAERILADEFLKAMIEQAHLTNQGEIILIPKVGGHKIIFGKYENADEKLRHLKAFYKEALPYEGWRKYSEISLQYKGQVVAR